MIRAHRANNPTPTPEQFQQSFRILLISGLIGPDSIIGTNCNFDTGDQLLLTVKQLLEPEIPNGLTKESDEQTKNVRSEIVNCDVDGSTSKIQKKILKAMKNCVHCVQNFPKKFDVRTAKTLISKFISSISHFINLRDMLFDKFHHMFDFSWNNYELHSGEIKKVMALEVIDDCIPHWCAKRNAVEKSKLEEKKWAVKIKKEKQKQGKNVQITE